MLNSMYKKWPFRQKKIRQVSLSFIAIISTLSLQAQCPAVNVPYMEDFESASTPSLPACTTIENVGNGSDWTTYDSDLNGFTGQYLRYRYDSDEPANVWFYTCGINLVANTAYKISYDYGSGDEDADYTERLKVAYGTSASAAGMTLPLADHPEITLGSTPNTVSFTPATSGVYYFGFNAYSDVDEYYLLVDNISIKAALPPTITNFTSSANCGQSTLLTINGTNLANATATIGGTALPLTTNTDGQITATVSSAMSGPIVVTTLVGTATSTTNFAFAINPALTLSNASATICAGATSDAVTVASNVADYTTYTWTPAANVTGNSTTGWTFNPAAGTSYVLNASNATTGCATSVNYTVSVTTNLPTPATVSTSALEVCQNATSASVTAASTIAPVNATASFSFGTDIELDGAEYDWDMDDYVYGTLTLNKTIVLPAGAVISSTKLVFSNVTTTDNTYVNELLVSLSGAVTLSSTIVADVDDEVVNGGPYEIITANIPATGGAVSLTLTNTYDGPATFGDISLVVEYTLPATLNLTWWNAATGGTQIGTGATLEAVGTTVLPTTATAGVYTVYAQASNGNCAAAPRAAVAITVKPNPTPVITAPSLVICAGSSLVLTSSATTGNVWSTTATTNTITVTAAGSYTVTTTEGTCNATSAPVVITVSAVPVAAASLTGNVTITATPAGQTYQWINCTTNAAIAGATNATFTATTNGSYKVIVTNAGGCKDTSACVNVSKVGLEEYNVDLGVTLYPNPTKGNVFVTMTELEQADLTVLDAQGKVVLTMNGIQNGAMIDLGENQKGIYLVKVSSSKGANVFRIMKD